MGSEWMNRSAKRKDLELTMYKTQTRRPSTQGKESIHTPPNSLGRDGECVSTALNSRRRDSEGVRTPSRSYSTNSITSAIIPSSPSGSVQSTAASSLRHSTECEDQLQTLLRKLRANTAEMDANEVQMRALTAMDEQVSTGISERLQVVQGMNHRLNDLSQLLARVEDLSRGNF